MEIRGPLAAVQEYDTRQQQLRDMQSLEQYRGLQMDEMRQNIAASRQQAQQQQQDKQFASGLFNGSNGQPSQEGAQQSPLAALGFQSVNPQFDQAQKMQSNLMQMSDYYAKQGRISDAVASINSAQKLIEEANKGREQAFKADNERLSAITKDKDMVDNAMAGVHDEDSFKRAQESLINLSGGNPSPYGKKFLGLTWGKGTQQIIADEKKNTTAGLSLLNEQLKAKEKVHTMAHQDNQENLEQQRLNIEKERAAIEDKRVDFEIKHGGRGGQSAQFNRIVSSELDNSARRLNEFLNIKTPDGGVPAISQDLLSKINNTSTFTGLIKNYALHGSLPDDVQEADKIALGLAFDIAGVRGGGRSAAISDSKIRQIINQFPQQGESDAVKRKAFRTILEQFKSGNKGLDDDFQVDPGDSQYLHSDLAKQRYKDWGTDEDGYHVFTGEKVGKSSPQSAERSSSGSDGEWSAWSH